MLKLSPDQAGNGPNGRELLQAGDPVYASLPLIVDSAYEGDETLRWCTKLYILAAW